MLIALHTYSFFKSLELDKSCLALRHYYNKCIIYKISVELMVRVPKIAFILAKFK